ncbi:MAG: hypothetical protein DRJ99_04175, partial [Thermoplasmata archaeon]
MKDGIKFVCISTIILLVIGGIDVGAIASGEHIQVLKRDCSSFSISKPRVDPSPILLGDVEVEISDTSINVGEKVIFHVIIRGTRVSSLGAVSYKYKIEMEFGDGTSNVIKFTNDKESYISHIYNKAGTFLPKIRVEDLDSGDEVRKDMEYVKVLSNNIKPRAKIELSKNVAKVGETITVDASQSYDPDGDKIYYRWDFDNDGVYHIHHHYQNPIC